MLGAPALIQRSIRLRRAIRWLAGLVNPLVLRVAGRRWMPVVGVLHHRGRRTGRLYATPLGMRPLGDCMVIPRTFGDGAAWYRNLLAAKAADISYGGRTATFDAPSIGDLSSISSAFPRYERLLFRLLGIDDFLIVRARAEAPAQPG